MTGGRGRSARRVVTAAFLVAVLVIAAREIYLRRSQLGSALADLPIWSLAVSMLCGLAGVVATMLMWRAVLGSLGARLGLRESARIFFLGQLGKYLPGSVWPLVAQAELARRTGTPRAITVAANLITLLASVALGLVTGCLLLPLTSPGVFRQFWWLLLVLPVLLVCLHPRLLHRIVDRALRLARRPPLPERVDGRLLLRGIGFGACSWLLLGLHIFLLVSALAGASVSTLLACVGGIALATAAGVLFIPAPAGAGVREVVLVLALNPVLNSTRALSVALVSRAMLIVIDFVLGGAQALVQRRHAGASAEQDGALSTPAEQ